MTSSTVSSESAPRSSMNFASGVTWSAFTPNCSTMMSLTRCSIVFSAMVYSGSNFCSVSMRRFGTRQAPNQKKLHGHAAIHGQHLAGDIVRPRAGEEQYRRRHVFRLAKRAQRNLLDDAVLLFLGQLVGHGRLDEARRNGVYRDAPAGHFAGAGLGETNDACLAGPVIALAGVADKTDHRGDVDNPARTLLEKTAYQRFGEKERALQIDVQHGVPVRLAHAHEQAVFGNARVVDQDVHLARGGQDLLRGGFDAGGIGYIRGKGPGLASESLNLLHRLSAELQLQIHTGNIRACGSEFQGNGLADTTAGARHNCYLIR